MRGVRSVILSVLAALALSGCLRSNAPVATAQPQGDLDSLAYGRSYGAVPAATAAAYAAAPAAVRHDTAYRLDAGDRLRVVVYGQDGLTNTYAIDAGGAITMPLIGSVPTRGRTTAGLAAEISAKLRNGYLREPSVAVEIEAYRPFFILGEVAAPGQYPYVPNMSVESAVAIAGGFSPRARRDRVTLSHADEFGADAGRGAARHLGWARRYRAGRRTLVLIMPETTDKPLRILHVVRAPVGGIFRHILDLANGQADRGHHVGIVADSLTGGDRAKAALQEIAPRLKLGVHRLAIRREPYPTDVLVWMRFMRLSQQLRPDVLHGHGAKAGAFVRLRARSEHTIRVYTPHGGSLHYPLQTLKGKIYSRLERTLMNSTDQFLFESTFARDTYQRMIGTPTGLVRCVFNGVTADEFDPVVQAPDATDLVYVGEFRHIKGADLLIDAVARLHVDGKPVTLTLAGDGEEMESLKAQVSKLGLTEAVRFIGHVKARYGFSKGKLLIVPSRGDSMPYVVIEAAAAGIPMIAAKVGGIPEIFDSHTEALFASGSVGAMADAIRAALEDPAAAQVRAESLRERVFQHFSQKAMVEGVMAGYRDAFAGR